MMQNLGKTVTPEALDAIEKVANECSELAARMALEFASQGFAQHKKPDKTWVTDADLHIEKVLRQKISQAFPDHRILGEEGDGATDSAAALREGGVLWVLDPIDGTFSFVNGVPFYSSLLAVLVDGVPELGFAVVPGLGWTLRGRRGRGAFFNGTRLDPKSPKARPSSEILAVADPYRFRMAGFPQVADILLAEPFKTRVYPDALGYMLLLQGAVYGFVDPKTEVWDVAPFHVILPEAGFCIAKWDGRVELSAGSVYSHVAQEDNQAGSRAAKIANFLTEA